jgi:pilus assembly protein FimV
MPFDKRKALQTALVFTQQGRWDKAISEYQAILKSDPTDLSVYNMLGDLYARIGDKEEAISYYLKLGELYRADGLSVKAIAVYKKIIKLDPANIPSYLACGDLYAEQGLVAEARIQYLTAADSFGKEGLTKKALNVYQKLADLDPANLTIRAKLGEMLIKEGLQKEAADEFLKVASGCTRIGQFPEAERFYKRVLQIASESSEARLGLGQLYYRSNDFSNAIDHLSRVFMSGQWDIDTAVMLSEAYQKSRELEKAEEVLSQVLEKNPEAPNIKILLGRLKLKTGKIEDGYLIFNEIAESDLERNEAANGLELLKEVKSSDPGFLKVRRRLVDLYRKVGDEIQARQELNEIAELLYQRNEWAEARSAFLEILQAEPDNGEVQNRLTDLQERLKEPMVQPELTISEQAEAVVEPQVVAAEEPSVEFEAVEPEEEVAESIEVSFIEEVPEETSKDLVSALASSRDDIEMPAAKQVREHLVEAEIYLKYGIFDKAGDHLSRAVEIAPHDVEVHEKLKDLYLNKRDKEAVVKECLVLADLFEQQGDVSQATSEIEEILRLDPDHAVAKKKMEEIQAVSASRAEEALASSLEQIPILEEMGEEALSLESPLEMIASLEDAGDAEDDLISVTEGPPMQEELPEEFVSLLEEEEPKEEAVPSLVTEIQAESSSEIEEDLAEADFYLQHEMVEEARSVYHRILEVDPLNKTAKEKLSELQPDLTDLEKPTEEEARPEVLGFDMAGISEGKPIALESVPSESAGLGLPPEVILTEEIPEAAAPSSEISLAKEVTPVFKVAPPTSVSAESDFIDFAAELEKELEGEAEAQQKALEELARSEIAPPTLNEILQEFQKGVRQTLEEKDFDTHYNLGIAYRDMDLLDEAIEEFRLASKDPSLALDSSQFIGLCYMKMGAVNLAIEEFLRGLSIPDQRPERYLGLKYELALGYEASGNFKNALDLFSEIFHEDSGFRDVAAKVKLLGTPKTQPPQKEETQPLAKEEPRLSAEKTPSDAESPPSPKPPKRKVHYI